jgi:hypothetical protein
MDRMSSLDLSVLAGGLRSRLAVIADHAHRDRDAAGHLQRLIDVSERIDAMVAALPSDELDPQFRHYLERRSYDKALAWIEGEDPKVER